MLLLMVWVAARLYQVRPSRYPASFWINTNPDTMLKTRFCDPLQITQKRAGDGGLWIDFPDTTFATYAAACPRAGASLTRGTPSAGASPRMWTTAPAGARSRQMSMTAQGTTRTS